MRHVLRRTDAYGHAWAITCGTCLARKFPFVVKAERVKMPLRQWKRGGRVCWWQRGGCGCKGADAMNSIWLKIAGVAVVAIVVIVVLGRFKSDKPASSTPTETKQAEKPKTFYDMADRDKQFAQAPKPAEPQPVEQQPPAATPPAPQPPQPPAQAPPQPAADNCVLPSSITQRSHAVLQAAQRGGRHRRSGASALGRHRPEHRPAADDVSTA